MSADFIGLGEDIDARSLGHRSLRGFAQSVELFVRNR
jgi:hypothetical protein